MLNKLSLLLIKIMGKKFQNSTKEPKVFEPTNKIKVLYIFGYQYSPIFPPSLDDMLLLKRKKLYISQKTKLILDNINDTLNYKNFNESNVNKVEEFIFKNFNFSKDFSTIFKF